MKLEQKDIYYDEVNALCGEYTVCALQHKEILGSETMDALWNMREQLLFSRQDENMIKNLISASKAKLVELEVFGHADF